MKIKSIHKDILSHFIKSKKILSCNFISDIQKAIFNLFISFIRFFVELNLIFSQFSTATRVSFLKKFNYFITFFIIRFQVKIFITHNLLKIKVCLKIQGLLSLLFQNT